MNRQPLPHSRRKWCEYPNCLLRGVRTVNGKRLCYTHASEYRQFLQKGGGDAEFGR